MSIRNDQDVYVTQTEKLERLQASHDRLLAAAERARLVIEEYCLVHSASVDGCLDQLYAAIAAAKEHAP